MRSRPAAVAAGAAALLVEEWLPLEVPQASRRVRPRRARADRRGGSSGEPSRAIRGLGRNGHQRQDNDDVPPGVDRGRGRRSLRCDRDDLGARRGARRGPCARHPRRPNCRSCSPSCVTTASRPWRWRSRRTRARSASRSTATVFAATCFTNLSHDHLDYHASLDEYFDVKSRLFTRTFTRAAAVHVGDPRGIKLTRSRRSPNGVSVASFAIADAATHRSAVDVVARDAS